MPVQKHNTPSPSSTANIGYHTDTIAALATPPGRGGIAVIRISGKQALPIVSKLCSADVSTQPRHVFLTDLISLEDDQQLLDKALVTYFKAPASFTGEDVVEISTHGGHVTPRRIIRALIALGARPADPGEFSLRAFLNGKMDLAEAEALNQMVSSLSRRAQGIATNNLTGQLSAQINGVKGRLLNLLTILEHELDFSEEEISTTSHREIESILTLCLDQLHRLKETAPYGRLIRDGIRTILAGPPNSGKSSLFNALVGHERAIVTDLPGTTRDSLEAWIDIDGFPVCLIDSAGLQDSSDHIEQIGIERSRQQISDADIILLLDPEDPFSVELGDVANKKGILHVKSKVDQPTKKADKEFICTSVRREDGLDELLEKLKEALNDYVPTGDSAIITSDRQLASLNDALDSLERIPNMLSEGQSMDIITGEIRLAINQLAEIIGETTSEDIIEKIFSEFCLGK